MNKLSTLLAAVALTAGLAVPVGPALASSGPELRLEPAPVNRLDMESLQRGARTFVNHCLNCHSAKFMRYNRLTDLGLTEQEIRDNLILGNAKIGDTMTVAMTAADARAWFGKQPPDLSVISRVRGSDWLYNYFLGFYRDGASATGWNNLVFPNVGMPHVLWDVSGTQKLVTKEFDSHAEAQGAALAAKRLAGVAPTPGHKYVLSTLEIETPGTMTPGQYRAYAADLVNFLGYLGEPARNQRINLGMIVLLYLGILFVFAYWLKREYWKDIH